MLGNRRSIMKDENVYEVTGKVSREGSFETFGRFQLMCVPTGAGGSLKRAALISPWVGGWVVTSKHNPRCSYIRIRGVAK